MLRFLPAEERERVKAHLVSASFTFGMPIVREGEEADAFYVLTAGQARVVKRGIGGEEVPLNVLRAGDCFGEIGLLERATRTATVRASSDVEVLRLDRAVFQAMLEQKPELRTYLELHRRHRTLNTFFHLYTPFATLPAAAVLQLIQELEHVTVERGALVIRAGDDAGPMYVVEDGHLRAFTECDGRREYHAFLRSGDVFGEISLITGEARTSNVEAVSACTLLCLPQASYRTLVEAYPALATQLEERVRQYDYKRLARVPLDFSEEVLPAAAQAQEPVGPRQLDDAAGTPDHADGDAHPFASREGHFIKRNQRVRRMKVVYQIDETDCGAAGLAMICRHFGRAVSLARIRELVHTSVDGTSLRAICRAAQELGLAARAVKCAASAAARMPLPAILHWDANHWVVLYDVHDGWASIADPALGLQRLPWDEVERRWSGYAALFDYTEAFESAPTQWTGLAWLWPFFRPFKSNVAQAVGLAVIVSGLEMVLPVFTQVIVDRVLVERDVALLHTLVIAMGMVFVFMLVAMLVQRYLLTFSAVRIDAAALDFLTRRLLALPMRYFTARRTGDIQRRLEGVRHIREFLVHSGVGVLTAMVQLVVALAVMLVYSRLLTAVFLASTPLFLLLMVFSARRLRPIFNQLEDGFARYSSYQIDAIKGIETVKAMGAEGTFRELLLKQFQALAGRRFRADLTIMSYDGAVQSVTVLSTILFLFVGALQVMDGALTIGGLVAFNSLVALANAPVLVLLRSWDQLQMSSVLLDRLSDVLEQEPEQGADHAHLLPVRTLEGRISFRNVSFRYGGPEAPAILDNVSFDVPAGRTVAIVGRSGSGKTTLVKCLAGLLEPTEGTVLYDGIELRTLSYRDLRRCIGFVLQDNHLFDDTLARNIAFGEEEPDLDRVVWATRMANAHEFIDRLPLGYDTRVGESGIALSGGQRQRVAIARALYQQPPVLVFDEATSSLDTESERAIKENLERHLRGRTAFVIAHRLSTVRNADVILVVEKGKIVEHGTHDDLMQRQGLYFYLCSEQLSL